MKVILVLCYFRVHGLHFPVFSQLINFYWKLDIQITYYSNSVPLLIVIVCLFTYLMSRLGYFNDIHFPHIVQLSMSLLRGHTFAYVDSSSRWIRIGSGLPLLRGYHSIWELGGEGVPCFWLHPHGEKLLSCWVGSVGDRWRRLEFSNSRLWIFLLRFLK